MIRVRYLGSNELSPGLHATAEQQGRRTTVYLLDGMTAAERRSALRRLRLTARMGHCPQLPARQLALALFADRIRTGLRRAGAVLRLHPAGSTVPIMVLSGGAIAFLLFSTVSIHVLHPRDADQSAAGVLPTASASAIAIGTGSQGQATGQGGVGNANDPGGAGRQADPNGLGQGSDPRQLTRPGRGADETTPALAAGTGSGSTRESGTSGSGNGGSGSGTTASSSKSSGGGTTLSGGAPPSQVTTQQSTPATSNPATSAASTTPATTPTQAGSSAGSSTSGSSSGSGSSSSGGVCLDVGPLGVCLDL